MDHSNVDIRDLLFEGIRGVRFAAHIVAHDDGVLSGSTSLRERGEEIGVSFSALLPEGAHLQSGTVIAEFTGLPKELALCEESLMGLASKYSGVASAAARASSAAGRMRVVCGAWKKMPVESKQALRRAITTGGMPTRLVDQNFMYLDKNYVRMLGGIRPTLAAARSVGHRMLAIQLRGETLPIGSEAIEAVKSGADVLMVDTGHLADAREVSSALRAHGVRTQVSIAYAGGLHIEDLRQLQDEDIDIVDIGRAVIDAPLLDMSMDVTGRI